MSVLHEKEKSARKAWGCWNIGCSIVIALFLISAFGWWWLNMVVDEQYRTHPPPPAPTRSQQ